MKSFNTLRLATYAGQSQGTQVVVHPQLHPCHTYSICSTSLFPHRPLVRRQVTSGHPLSTLAFFLLSRTGLVARFRLDALRLARFLRAAESCYQSHPYHNNVHASDVLQTLHMVLTWGGLVPHYADPLTQLACYISAVCHDLNHRGGQGQGEGNVERGKEACAGRTAGTHPHATLCALLSSMAAPAGSPFLHPHLVLEP